MRTIQSFSINHDYLKPGMYISRVDGDVITYDLRMVVPNNPEGIYLENSALHSVEHLFATYVRNSDRQDEIIYVGPMGCRTGFYFLTRDTLSGADAIRLTQESMAYIVSYQGEIPGARRQECGNYLAHDLEGARQIAKSYLQVLEHWSPEQLTYPPEVLGTPNVET